MENRIVELVVSLTLAIVIVLTDIILIAGISITNGNVYAEQEEKEESKISIIDIQNNSNKYYIKCDKIDDANKYVLEVLNEDKVLASSSDIEGNLDFEIPLESLRYGNKYILNISAYKDEDLLLKNKDEIFIIWSEPSFSVDNKDAINNKTYSLKIDGTLDEEYHLVIKNKDNILYDETITKNTFEVPSKLFLNKNIDLDFYLYHNEKLVSTFSANNKYVKPTTTVLNPIKDVKIISPSSYTSLKDVKDITIEYTGGDNATEKYIFIYENNIAIKRELLTSNTYIIPSSTFKSESSYKVLIEATDGKFKKSAYVYISTVQNGGQKMVDLARTQLGVKQGLKYAKWYGFKGRVEWCAVFISWVANELGYLKTAIPKFAGVGVGWRWFNNRGLTKKAKSGYVPKAGDIIFFDFESNGRIDHVGIVEYSDGKYVYTIEGNSGDECKQKKYKINYSGIHGYATPQY